MVSSAESDGAKTAKLASIGAWLEQPKSPCKCAHFPLIGSVCAQCAHITSGIHKILNQSGGVIRSPMSSCAFIIALFINTLSYVG